MVRHDFTEPHNGDRASGQGERYQNDVHEASGIDSQSAQPAGHADGLNEGENDRPVASPLNDLLSAFFSLFLQLFNARHNDGEQLHYDAGVDVGGNTQREYTETAECSASKKIKESKNGSLIKQPSEGCCIHSGSGHVGAKTVHEQRCKRKKDAALQIRQPKSVPE